MAVETWFDEESPEWAQTLVGRRIVKAETREGDFYPENEEGILTLDDGTELMIRPNKGGCICGGGDYFLEHFQAGSGGLITSAKITHDEADEGMNTWQLFVLCEGMSSLEKIITIEGDDGNGYYGTGYAVKVTRVA